MRKIIIIGAKGMLGQALQKEFSQNKNYQVLAWDMEDLDITNKTQVKTKLVKENPDIIINAAAYNAVDQAEENEESFELAKKINALGPKYLAETAKTIKAIFVQYVTDYVFDGEKGEYNEEDKTHPISNYGKSKELGEKNVLAIKGKNYLIRTSKLFGQPGKGEQAKKSFFAIMIELSKEREMLKVIDEEKSCFTYVPDLAKATGELIEKKYPWGIYHLINEGAVTWYQGVKTLFKIMGIKGVKVIPVKAEIFQRSAQRPRASVLLNTKFKKLRNYQEAIKDWLGKGEKKQRGQY